MAIEPAMFYGEECRAMLPEEATYKRGANVKMDVLIKLGKIKNISLG